MSAPEWAVWVSPIASLALGAFGAWMRGRVRTERIVATETERKTHIDYRFDELNKRDHAIEQRLSRLEDKPVNGYAGFAERLKQSEQFIHELREWKETRGETYHGAFTELRQRLDLVEREIGDQQSGIRGWIHKKGNEIQGRLQNLEQRRR